MNRANKDHNTARQAQVDRRKFLGASVSASCVPGLLSGAIAGPFEPADTADHFVPADKKLSPEWLHTLYHGEKVVEYSGELLDNIFMPVGGICTGQLYLTGDGRLAHWDIFNSHNFSGYGANNYGAVPKPDVVLEQGAAIAIEQRGKRTVYSLDRKGFPDVRFLATYPVARLFFERKDTPVVVKLQAYSPFIPLNEQDSGLPVTVLEYTIVNRGKQAVNVAFATWLENGCCCHSQESYFGKKRNEALQSGNLALINSSAYPTSPPRPEREPIVLADFEGPDYGRWEVHGEAFGKGPAHGTAPRQQPVSGFLGKGLVNSYPGSDQPQGRLVSPPFTINRRFISFLIGGGSHKGKTCVNLLVDGKVVRTATGKNNERLEWQDWNVTELEGKQARIEIVDAASGSWGHINVDQIELRDTPRAAPQQPLQQRPDFGTMCLGLVSEQEDIVPLAANCIDPRLLPAALFDPGVLGSLAKAQPAEQSFGKPLVGALGCKLTLQPGEEHRLTVLVTWHFPNLFELGQRRGRYYAKRFTDAVAVARYVAENLPRLRSDTLAWYEAWYSSNMPQWLLHRLMAPVSALATNTCQWWENGRFWAYEGVCCCRGTCSHVWNYEHALARLFPALERSVRIMQDFDPNAGFDEQTGMIRFRGEGWRMWAGDAQAGTILKVYREHQMTTDEAFLRSIWPRVRKALEFLFQQDGDANGILEGSQHTTYDINFFGPNTFVGSLYLAALRAGEEMALLMGDKKFAQQCRELFLRGKAFSETELFNGEYFVQKVDLKQHPKYQYADGCLSDQLFGQGWAHQIKLGYIYDVEKVRSALRAIWTYNWTPDIGPHNRVHPPERWFARPGQAGLFVCTWPKSKHMGANGVRYRNEVWTGTEYQVAGHMAWEGMVTEALAICRGVHERYHPRFHNPFNEVECGDHYARAMASYGVYLALCGYEYDGPRNHLGFAPRLNAQDFRCAFTAAKGWGVFSQKQTGTEQQAGIRILWGQLQLQSLSLGIPDNASPRQVEVALIRPTGKQLLAAGFDKEKLGPTPRLVIKLEQPVTIAAGEELTIAVRF